MKWQTFQINSKNKRFNFILMDIRKFMNKFDKYYFIKKLKFDMKNNNEIGNKKLNWGEQLWY